MNLLISLLDRVPEFSGLLAAIEGMRRDGIDPAAFARAKKALYGNFLRGFNDVEDIAGMMCRNILNGVNLFRFQAVYDTVDVAFAAQRLQEVFCEDNMAMSIVWPANA